ncbi:uncharacterized protein LACBIDRAFT_300101 [Laccaria bicolor S238N-H82]|uniref:Predicted protein n=1 Tax=Laccaria bicolor (strain S238N-H82 / ATCC MYA-4686) TaxID=486041 RepID=B0DG10_LACBS|nr:uncharacterized protein LACBIDRAFT_300101 [Laccaria bicolor S238N-H82]EDR06434.1 predicted protein [Laccaria bicolor S238N-H82]|eukprot:XP_001882806.1 predicted protein [Laccaria bicolor S238N-H82]
MLDERDTLRDKVYTFFEGGNELWEEDGSTEWDVIDADWIGWQRRTWDNVEAAARERAQKNIPILQLETIPPDVPFVECWYYTKNFRRNQLQAHPWEQRDDPEVREALFFEDTNARNLGELIRVDILLPPIEPMMPTN